MPTTMSFGSNDENRSTPALPAEPRLECKLLGRTPLVTGGDAVLIALCYSTDSTTTVRCAWLCRWWKCYASVLAAESQWHCVNSFVHYSERRFGIQ